MIVSTTYPEPQRYAIALALSLTLTAALASVGALLADFLVLPLFETGFPAQMVATLLTLAVSSGAMFGLLAARTTV